jgi:hypothetical protein
VYDLIADYHQGHPSILPPQYFQNVVVEAGGRGAGTRIRFTMKSYGVTKTCYASITEPEPGRVLIETDRDTGTTTHFLVEPTNDGKTRVTFDTAYNAVGFRGLIEALLVPAYLRKVYAAELQRLAERAVAAATHSQSWPSNS